MENKDSFNWKDGLLIMATLAAVIELVISPEVRKFITNPQTWACGLRVAAVIIWGVDRYRRAMRWFKEAGSSIDSTISRHMRTLTEAADTFKIDMVLERNAWARTLQEIVDRAVQCRATVAMLEAEKEARIEADAEIIRHLEAIESRLQHMV